MSQERDFSTLSMKLHKSILISLFVHMLAFGSAFAYAYYSGDAFTRAFDSMTVLLVELGDEKNFAASRTKKQPENIKYCLTAMAWKRKSIILYLSECVMSLE